MCDDRIRSFSKPITNSIVELDAHNVPTLTNIHERSRARAHPRKISFDLFSLPACWFVDGQETFASHQKLHMFSLSESDN